MLSGGLHDRYCCLPLIVLLIVVVQCYLEDYMTYTVVCRSLCYWLLLSMIKNMCACKLTNNNNTNKLQSIIQCQGTDISAGKHCSNSIKQTTHTTKTATENRGLCRQTLFKQQHQTHNKIQCQGTDVCVSKHCSNNSIKQRTHTTKTVTEHRGLCRQTLFKQQHQTHNTHNKIQCQGTEVCVSKHCPNNSVKHTTKDKLY